MKWQRILLTSALVAGLAVGCGGEDDDPAQTNQENANQSNTNQGNSNQNNSNQNNQTGPDNFADDVDVWVGSVINNEGNLTTVEVGESFGGRFENDGAHFFSLELEAGQVVTLSKVGFEADLESSPEHLWATLIEPDFGGGLTRFFFPGEHDERQFFVTETGAYTVQVVHDTGDDARGEDVGFALRAEISDVEVSDDLSVPGRTTGLDLNDGAIDAYSFSVNEEENVDLELFSTRQPVESELDAWVYVWDVDAGELVADGESQSQNVYDPRILFEAQAGTDYWIVVDAVFNVSDAEYELDAQFVSSTPTNPIELSLDGVDVFEGTILERASAAYNDYFTVTVSPGEYKSFTVQGTDELEPLLSINDLSSPAPPATAQAVDQLVGVTLGLAADAGQETTYLIQLTDARNAAGDVQSYHGGEDYGYVAFLESAEPTVHTISGQGSATINLASPGEVQFLDVSAGANELLWLDSGVDRDNLNPADLSASGFLPAWVMGDGSTLAWTNSYFDGFYRSVGENVSFMIRDRLFRGGAAFGTEARVLAFDVDAPSYGSAGLDSGGDNFGDAPSLALPARISGSLEEPAEGESDGQRFYFSIDAQAGDFLVVSTENDSDVELFLALLDDDGEVVTRGSLLMEQIQEGDSPYYDSALVYEIDQTGSFVLELEQACGWWGCDVGQAQVSVFLD